MTSFTNTTTTYPEGANTPIKRVKAPTAPTPNPPTSQQAKNFILGDEWLDTSTGDWWKLTTNLPSGVIWARLAGVPGQTETLTGDTGGAVGPDASANINILGTAGQISVTGSPGTNTLTLALTGGGTAIDSFIPDAGTSPVVPSAAGAVTMVGGNGVLTTGGLNTLTFDMQSPFTGDFDFTKATAGAPEVLSSTHTDNTNTGSDAAIKATVAGTSGGDAYVSSIVGTTRSYAWGADTSASQTLKINTTNAATATPSSGTNLWSMTSGGARTMPLQPAFSAYFNATSANATGDGTIVTPIIFNATVFDNASSYGTGTGLFTAPVTGKYLLTVSLVLTGLDASFTDAGSSIVLTGSAPVYATIVWRGNVGAVQAGAIYTLNTSQIVFMTAGNTAHVNLQVSGGTKTVNIFGAALAFGVNPSLFSGFLLC